MNRMDIRQKATIFRPFLVLLVTYKYLIIECTRLVCQGVIGIAICSVEALVDSWLIFIELAVSTAVT